MYELKYLLHRINDANIVYLSFPEGFDSDVIIAVKDIDRYGYYIIHEYIGSVKELPEWFFESLSINVKFYEHRSLEREEDFEEGEIIFVRILKHHSHQNAQMEIKIKGKEELVVDELDYRSFEKYYKNFSPKTRFYDYRVVKNF